MAAASSGWARIQSIASAIAAGAEALSNIFVEDAPRPVISSTKGATGHLLGSAGAIETIATILALNSGEAPVMGTTLDPEDISFRMPLPETDRKFDGSVAMKNSLGFGGLNGSLILERLTTGAT